MNEKNVIAHDFAWVAAFDVVERMRPLLRDDAGQSFEIIFPVIEWAIQEALRAKLEQEAT